MTNVFRLNSNTNREHCRQSVWKWITGEAELLWTVLPATMVARSSSSIPRSLHKIYWNRPRQIRLHFNFKEPNKYHSLVLLFSE